jgi:hypothetical protein
MASFDEWADNWATGLEDMAGEAVMNAVGFVLQVCVCAILDPLPL